MTTIDQLLSSSRDAITVRRVFGEPYEKNGVAFIPAASVSGGGGAGEGEATDKTPGGAGGGFGMTARPVGAYRIKGEDVVWVPSVDVTKIAVIGEIVALVALLVIRSIFKARTRRR